jgi:hypothetical protein
LSHSRDANSQSGCFFEAQVVRDVDLDVAFGDDEVLESSVFVVDFVASMTKTADSVTFLEWFCDFASDFLDDTGIIATNLNSVVISSLCFR